MVTVRQLLHDKGNVVWSVPPQASVYDSLKLMAEKNIGAVLVIDDKKLAGIFSERDYARKIILKGLSSKDTCVADLMTPKVLTVDPNKTLEDCMVLMSEKHVRHLPVVENGALVGLISIGDVVNRLISDQKFSLRELKNYISGGG